MKVPTIHQGLDEDTRYEWMALFKGKPLYGLGKISKAAWKNYFVGNYLSLSYNILILL